MRIMTIRWDFELKISPIPLTKTLITRVKYQISMWNHFYTPLTIVPHLYYQFQVDRRDEIFRPKTRIIRLKYPQHHLRTSPRVSSIDLATIRQHSFFHTKCRIIREKSSPMSPYTSYELPLCIWKRSGQVHFSIQKVELFVEIHSLTSHIPPMSCLYRYEEHWPKSLFPYKKSNYSLKITLRLPIYLPYNSPDNMTKVTFTIQNVELLA